MYRYCNMPPVGASVVDLFNFCAAFALALVPNIYTIGTVPYTYILNKF
jgi:hypothetical protein